MCRMLEILINNAKNVEHRMLIKMLLKRRQLSSMSSPRNRAAHAALAGKWEPDLLEAAGHLSEILERTFLG